MSKITATDKTGNGSEMSRTSTSIITKLLVAWNNGDQQALEKLTHLVYDELHSRARYYMLGERPENPLQATALINEIFIRLINQKRIRWENRAHFYRMAARL